MKKTFNFNDCYHILRLETDCSQVDLRRSYKKLIQKWHPDRFKDGSKEQLAADEKIKAINIAYNQLNKYYRDKGNLLQVKPTQHTNKTHFTRQQQTKTSDTKKRKVQSELYQKNRLIAPKFKIKKNTYTGITTLTLLFIFYYLYTSNFESQTTDLGIVKSSYQIIPTNNKHISRNNMSQKNQYTSSKLDRKHQSTIHERLRTEKAFFTQGSTLGEVVAIQGVPSKIDNDIWYYGESEVHFKSGKVSHWVRNIKDPLKASLNFNSTKAPYPNQ